MSPTDAAARFHALVPCAGVGARVGGDLPKQYLVVAGRPIVGWTVAALARVARLATTLVVLAPDDDRFAAAVPDFGRLAGQRIARVGGATRAATVAAGLKELLRNGAAGSDWVLVHDAARCLVEPAWVDRLIDACAGDDVGGLLALPLTDTLKEESAGRAAATIPRRHKWVAQTPQMFRLADLAEALARVGDAVTDEASAIEATGRRPRLVEGDAFNIKVTWPQDLVLAERLLADRGAEIKAFVPARDFALSQRFYAALGFRIEWVRGDLALLRVPGAAFLLQAFDAPGLAENAMMHMTVDDLDAWWSDRVEAAGLAATYHVRAEPPAQRPWGLRDATLTDPSGVLWRIAARPSREDAR